VGNEAAGEAAVTAGGASSAAVAAGHSLLQGRAAGDTPAAMFSHIVIFWTDPAKPEAGEALVGGANKLLKSIPGLVHFHAGKMAGSARPVVDQSYQVALNTVFTSKQAQDEYQTHPSHLKFVETYVKPLVKKIVVYDFE
jgi:hypothetical protein